MTSLLQYNHKDKGHDAVFSGDPWHITAVTAMQAADTSNVVISHLKLLGNQNSTIQSSFEQIRSAALTLSDISSHRAQEPPIDIDDYDGVKVQLLTAKAQNALSLFKLLVEERSNVISEREEKVDHLWYLSSIEVKGLDSGLISVNWALLQAHKFQWTRSIESTKPIPMIALSQVRKLQSGKEHDSTDDFDTDREKCLAYIDQTRKSIGEIQATLKISEFKLRTVTYYKLLLLRRRTTLIRKAIVKGQLKALGMHSTKSALLSSSDRLRSLSVVIRGSEAELKSEQELIVRSLSDYIAGQIQETFMTIYLQIIYLAWLYHTSISLNSSWRQSIKTNQLVPYESPIFYYSMQGDIHGVQNIFAQGLGSPMDVDMDGKSLLYYAARFAQVEMCRFLLQNGADVRTEDRSRRSPLHALAEGANYMPSESDEKILSTLRVLSSQDSYESNTQDKNGNNFFHIYGGPPLGYLIALENTEYHRDMDQADKYGYRPLHAILSRLSPLVDGPSMEASPISGEQTYPSSLQKATTFDATYKGPWRQIILRLLQARVDIHAVTSEGKSPLNFVEAANAVEFWLSDLESVGINVEDYLRRENILREKGGPTLRTDTNELDYFDSSKARKPAYLERYKRRDYLVSTDAFESSHELSASLLKSLNLASVKPDYNASSRINPKPVEVISWTSWLTGILQQTPVNAYGKLKYFRKIVYSIEDIALGYFRSVGDACLCASWPKLSRIFHRIGRPRLKEGTHRILWNCGCGQELYADLQPAHSQAIIDFKESLKFYSRGPQSSADPAQQSDAQRSGTSNKSLSVSPGNSTLDNTSDSSLPSTMTPGTLDETTDVKDESSKTKTRRFLLLCVKTGRFVTDLAQINTTYLGSDEILFKNIRSEYESLRGRKLHPLSLFKPSAIHPLKFELLPSKNSRGACVGGLEFPSLPPAEIVLKKRLYFYKPCPVNVTVETFLHVQPFLNHFYYPHTCASGSWWFDRLPTKLESELAFDAQNMTIGWGLQIVESLNWGAITIFVAFVVFASFLFSIIWSVLEKDLQGGFGMGSFFVAAGSVFVAVWVTYQPVSV